MKYVIIICMLFTSCSIFKKSVNQQKQEINKSVISFRDSIGRLTTDVTSTSLTTGWVASATDSGYDKVTEELIKDYGDSIFTVRTIKEKGQKRTEQLSHTTKFDSASSMITEHSQLQELEKEDSAVVTTTTQKTVNRTSLFPWWIWLIIAGVAILGWWQRNPIMEFLLPNKKAR